MTNSKTYILRSGGAYVGDVADLTATAAELNIMDGVTATTAELNLNDGEVANVVFTVGADLGGTANVAMQFNDAAGTAMAIRTSVFVYLSDDANGDSIAATAPDGGIAVGTDGLAIPVVANKAFQCTTEADGDLDLTLTESGAATWYLAVVLPSGKLLVSTVITFTA
jgi:hypothetical protein